MNNKVKLYGKVVNTWKTRTQFIDWNGNKREKEIITQYEVAFTEYNLDGSIYRKGTEDFSAERYRSITSKWVHTWDGKNLNRGGKRKFDDRGMIKFLASQSKEVKQLLASKYAEAELIQLR